MPDSGIRSNDDIIIRSAFIERLSASSRRSRRRNRFLIPLLSGFAIGFLLQLNVVLWTSEQDKFMLTYRNGIINSSLNLRLVAKLNATGRPIQSKSRILCWIMSKSAPMNKYIRETWGKRCDYLLFMVSKKKKHTIDEVKLNISKLPSIMPTYWKKTTEAWHYIYKNYLDKADWFLAAEYDSYVVVENLHRHLGIYNYDSNSSIYMGHAYQSDIFPFVYISISPAYILNKAALQKFGKADQEPSLYNPFKTGLSFQSESFTLGHFMHSLGVTAVDARDVSSRLLFIPNPLLNRIFKKTLPFDLSIWNEEDFEPVQRGMDCCSDVAIVFHTINPSESLLLYEYLIYQLRPYGYNLFAEPNY